MKSVLIISCVFPPEPVVSANISFDLALALKKENHQVTVIAPLPTRPHGFKFDTGSCANLADYYKKKLPGIDIINTNSKTSPGNNMGGRLAESYSFGKEAASFIKKQYKNYDVVYINSWPIFSQYFIARACIKYKLPYVMHIQDIYPESLTNKLSAVLKSVVYRIFINIEKYNLKNAGRVLAISESMEKYLIATRPGIDNKITIVYNWQDNSEFDLVSSQSKKEEMFTFMYLGNIGPVAGVSTVINAYNYANLAGSRLVIAGNGSQKDACIQLAAKYPSSDIQFINVPQGEVARIQHKADVLLLPVIKGAALSSIPSKLPAYMFSKKPVLASVDLESDTAKTIIDAQCGWVCEPDNEKLLTEKMKMAIDLNSDELKVLGLNGYNYAIANFSKKVNLHKLVSEIISAANDI
jgi:glycosyltransferase involved in cell wall biosynthesis